METENDLVDEIITRATHVHDRLLGNAIVYRNIEDSDDDDLDNLWACTEELTNQLANLIDLLREYKGVIKEK